MQHILVYSDSLSWGIIPKTRKRLLVEQRLSPARPVRHHLFLDPLHGGPGGQRFIIHLA